MIAEQHPPRESALIVPVPAAEKAVRPMRKRLDPSLALGMPAHITVLYPFAPPAVISDSFAERLDELFGGSEPFDFSLSRLGWFDQRVMFLDPLPQAPFVELTATISAEFPDYLPYRGTFDKVVPHLTVGEGASPARMRRAGRRLQRRLPIVASATEVWLMAPGPSGHWGVERRFPLGPTPVDPDGRRRTDLR